MRNRGYRQNTVVVRVDVILYAVTAAVVILVLASVVTHDVDVALIGTLLTFITTAFGSYLTYLRLCSRTGKHGEADSGDGAESPPGEGAGLGPPAPSSKRE